MTVSNPFRTAGALTFAAITSLAFGATGDQAAAQTRQPFQVFRANEACPGSVCTVRLGPTPANRLREITSVSCFVRAAPGAKVTIVEMKVQTPAQALLVNDALVPHFNYDDGVAAYFAVNHQTLAISPQNTEPLIMTFASGPLRSLQCKIAGYVVSP